MTYSERKKNKSLKRPREPRGSMQKYVYYAVAIAIAVVLYAFQSPQRAKKKEVISAEPAPSLSSTPSPDLWNPPPDAIDDSELSEASDKTKTPVTATPTPATKQKSRSSVKDHLPGVDQIRDEVKRDPHSPPPSGAAFALELATRMQEAETSRESAEKLFAELEECGTNRNASVGVPSLKALCIQSARDLTKQYPEFQSRYEQIKKKADPRAASIADQVR